jgi:hypothetical protein
LWIHRGAYGRLGRIRGDDREQLGERVQHDFVEQRLDRDRRHRAERHHEQRDHEQQHRHHE